MKTNDQLLAQAHKEALEEFLERPDSPEARARNVALLQVAISQARPLPSKSRMKFRLALAAGLGLLLGASAWFAAQPRGAGGVVASSGALKIGQPQGEAEVVESGERTLSLQLSPGVLVHLRAQSAVQVRDAGARVVVRRGEVAAEVTARDSLLFLESGDTEVATRGAHFSVKVGAGCDGRSQVEVSAGSVVIAGRTKLQAGERWPRCSAPAPRAPVSPTPTAPAPRARPQVTKRTNAPPPPTPNDDRLARHNELYLEALELQRAGNVAAAVKKLEAVLADPSTPLAETALSQKMKWLSATNRPAAREAAKDYLQRFPMGFGRADAEQLVLESP